MPQSETCLSYTVCTRSDRVTLQDCLKNWEEGEGGNWGRLTWVGVREQLNHTSRVMTEREEEKASKQRDWYKEQMSSPRSTEEWPCPRWTAPLIHSVTLVLESRALTAWPPLVSIWREALYTEKMLWEMPRCTNYPYVPLYECGSACDANVNKNRNKHISSYGYFKYQHANTASTLTSYFGHATDFVIKETELPNFIVSIICNLL